MGRKGTQLSEVLTATQVQVLTTHSVVITLRNVFFFFFKLWCHMKLYIPYALMLLNLESGKVSILKNESINQQFIQSFYR